MHFMEYDSSVMTVIDKAVDLLILSTIWFICCIPLITVGASSTALYYSCVKTVRNNKGYLIKNFFRSFRMNFVPATFLWLIFLLQGILLSCCFAFTAAIPDKNFQFFMLCLYIFWAFLLLGIGCYAFPVLSRCSMKNINILKFSIGLVVRHFPSTIIMTVLVILAAFLMWNIPLTVFALPGAISIIYSLPMEKILIRYTPKKIEIAE